MKFAEAYSKWSNEGKNLFLLAMIALVGLAALICGFFINNPGLFFGWAFGSAVELLAYGMIIVSSRWLISTETTPGKKYLSVLFSVLRFFLYGGALLLAAFDTFRWHSSAHCYLSFWTVFAALLPMGVVVIWGAFRNVSKLNKAPNTVTSTTKEVQTEERKDV